MLGGKRNPRLRLDDDMVNGQFLRSLAERDGGGGAGSDPAGDSINIDPEVDKLSSWVKTHKDPENIDPEITQLQEYVSKNRGAGALAAPYGMPSAMDYSPMPATGPEQHDQPLASKYVPYDKSGMSDHSAADDNPSESELYVAGADRAQDDAHDEALVKMGMMLDSNKDVFTKHEPLGIGRDAGADKHLLNIIAQNDEPRHQSHVADLMDQTIARKLPDESEVEPDTEPDNDLDDQLPEEYRVTLAADQEEARRGNMGLEDLVKELRASGNFDEDEIAELVRREMVARGLETPATAPASTNALAAPAQNPFGTGTIPSRQTSDLTPEERLRAMGQKPVGRGGQ